MQYIEKPKISGTKDEQIAQLKSALYQLIDSLNYNFAQIEKNRGGEK